MSRALRHHEISGWPAITLAGRDLAVTVLPTKGADIQSVVHRASGVDALFHAPWGLAPPGAPPRAGSDGHAFLERYQGGWQELLPNTNDACHVGGVAHAFHGEVATAAWDVVEESPGSVLLRVACRTLPLVLERRMTVADSGGSLVLDETVRNGGTAPCEFAWGHHCVLGAPLVGHGARLRTGGRTLVTPAAVWEQTARLEAGQRSDWPHARLRSGGTVDLRVVPGPEAASHDDVYLTDLSGGWAEVVNDRLGLRFAMEWDAAVFPWLISWQPFGGARALPLAGSYGLGVEPWSAGGNLAAAAAAGQALRLEAHASLSTTVRADFGALPERCHDATSPPAG